MHSTRFPSKKTRPDSSVTALPDAVRTAMAAAGGPRRRYPNGLALARAEARNNFIILGEPS